MTQTYHTVGGVHVVTRAYDADALSSVRCVNSIGIGRGQNNVVWEKMNYNDLYYPIPLSESYSRVDRCFSNRKDNDVWGDWMRKPFISLPKDVSELDPAWTTCSGVAIGAMDPPRALVPAAGFEDSPPNDPGPITQSSPDLPKATPGNNVPDPITGPTLPPQKGTNPESTSYSAFTPHAQVTVRPQPYSGPNIVPLTLLKDPQQDPPLKQPDPSPIVKEPSKSPEAAAPQPQNPSPYLPEVDPPDHTNDDPINGIGALPAVGNKEPIPKKPAGDPEVNTPSNQGQLDSISNALYPTSSPASGSDQKGEVSSDQKPVSKPNLQGGQSGDPSNNGPKPAQGSPSGHNDANIPTTSDLGNDSPAEKNQPGQPAPHNNPRPQGGDSSNDSSGNTSAKNSRPSGSEESGTDTHDANTDSTGSKKSDSGNNSKGSASPQSDNAPIVAGDTTIPQKHGNGNDRPGSGPTTFAFISNSPPPLAQGQTIARAPDGAAVIGTATIHPGEIQVVHGTPVSVAPTAIVVGSSTFAFNKPPQQKADETAARGAPMISQAVGGGLVIGTKTILPGQKDSVNGHEVSVGPSNVFIDNKSYSFPAITPPPLSASEHIDVAGLRIAQGFANDVVVGGSTYKPGVVATVSGHTLSVGSNSIIVDGSSHTFPTAAARSPLLIGDQTVRKDAAGNIIVGTTTLSSGNSETTIAGHAISLDASNHIIVDQQTYTLPTTAGPVQIPASQSSLVIAGQSISKNAAGDLLIGSSTLPIGSAITVAGHIISLPAQPPSNEKNNNLIID
ncbi:MAG: hypothetical protein LQ352_002925, partial [Teloschistes flavicans]